MKLSKSLFVGLMTIALLIGKIHAQSIEFSHGTVAEVLQQAKTSGKLVFIDCYTDWCGPCKYMAANTFTDPGVATVFNTQFINYKLDMEKGEGVDFAKKYNIRAYPTLLFIDSNGDLIHAAVGGRDAEAFIALGKEANDPGKQINTLIQKFKNGNREVPFLTDYILKGGRAGLEVSEAVIAWSELVKPEEMVDNKDFWEVFMWNFRRVDTDFFRYVVEHQSVFSEKYTPETVSMKLSMNYSQNLYAANQNKDVALVEKIKQEFIDACGEVAMEQLAKMDMYAAQENGDIKTFTEKATQIAEKYSWDDPIDLNNIVWGYFELVDNKKELKKAEKWIKRSIELEESSANLDTYGNLLAKMGHTKEAITVLQKAIEVGKANGEPYEDTQAALDKLRN